MKERHQTRYVQDKSQVPIGYVAMREFGVDGADYKAVARAQKNGLVRAVKLVRHEGDLKNGFVWVHKGDADTYLSSLVLPDSHEQLAEEQCVTPSQTASLDSKAEAAVIALCEISNGVTLMYDVLDRLTKAVESIATQPQTEEQVREAITTVCRNADGFDNFRS